MLNIDPTGLLQGILILFSAFLVISQLIIRGIREPEADVGRWATNGLIAVLIALYFFLFRSISRISTLVIESGGAEIEAVLDPMMNFIFLTGLLFAQYSVHQADDENSGQRVWVDYVGRVAIAFAIIIIIQNISIDVGSI